MSEHYPMPSLGAGMTAGRVIEWYVEPGQTVRKGDVVGLVDTDKGAIEMEIWEDAEIADILAPPGTKAPVGSPLLALRAPGEKAEPSVPPEREVATEAAAPPVPPEQERVTDAPEPEAAREEPVARGPAVEEAEGRWHRPPRASPAARKRAADLGIDLKRVTGTGPQGAITLADLEQHAEPEDGPAPPTSPAPTATPVARRAAEVLGIDLEGIEGTGARGAITREDVERAAGKRAPEPAGDEPDRHAAMRRAIAAAIARSKREIPHYYLAHTVPLENALRWLERTNRDRPPKERILQAALYLKAVSIALNEFPELNGFWEDDAFRPAEAVHPGLAISLRGGGLVAPAIHDVDEMSLDAITAAVRDLVQRARAGRLRGSEVTDATVTVTSLGDRGVETVFGVIYPPQVAIVGIGTPVERPWAEDGMIGVRRTAQLTLAADHRASDGHRGGLFLERVGDLLQTPEEL